MVHVVPGFAAASSGLIKRGDMLEEIDGLNVSETSDLKEVLVSVVKGGIVSVVKGGIVSVVKGGHIG